jgi:DNA-binding transcriptional ArsR family regulator
MTNQPEEISTMQILVQRAQAFADVTRLRILRLLLEGETTVSDIVTRLGIPQPRASTHLAFLRQVGLVSVDRLGRQRVYRPDAPRIKAVLAALQACTPMTPPRSLQAGREVQRNTALRQARTCYDHLAGVAGVQLLDAMLRRGWLEHNENAQDQQSLYHLTPQGTQVLSARGVDVVRAHKARRRFAFGCMDWTERRAHLGGALGAAIFETLVTAGLVQRQPQSRTVVFQKPIVDWLDTPSSNPRPL